jgi:hypothetical protein
MLPHFESHTQLPIGRSEIDGLAHCLYADIYITGTQTVLTLLGRSWCCIRPCKMPQVKQECCVDGGDDDDDVNMRSKASAIQEYRQRERTLCDLQRKILAKYQRITPDLRQFMTKQSKAFLRTKLARPTYKRHPRAAKAMDTETKKRRIRESVARFQQRKLERAALAKWRLEKKISFYRLAHECMTELYG